jgi:ribosome recycling factor
MSFDKNDIQRRMNGAVETLNKEFAGLRTGRASASLLDPVTVEVYGTRMPINQIGTVNVPEPRLISVQVWDNSNVRAVEKAIREAGLGLNPQIEGTLLRISCTRPQPGAPGGTIENRREIRRSRPCIRPQRPP